MRTLPELVILLVLGISVMIYRNSKDGNALKNVVIQWETFIISMHHILLK